MGHVCPMTQKDVPHSLALEVLLDGVRCLVGALFPHCMATTFKLLLYIS